MENLIPSDYPDFFSKGEPPCASTDPEAFYPQDMDGLKTAIYYNETGAKLVCKTCPYMVQCLEYAIKNNEIGIWGGTTEGQRKRLKRQLNAGIPITEIAVSIRR